jgi:hypothetical protein
MTPEELAAEQERLAEERAWRHIRWNFLNWKQRLHTEECQKERLAAELVERLQRRQHQTGV